MQIKDLIKQDNFSVRCYTEEQARALFTALAIYGYSWTSGNRLSLYYLKWDSYKEKTIYKFDNKNKKVTYSRVDNEKDYYEFTEINFCFGLCNNVAQNTEDYYTATYEGKYCDVYYGIPNIVENPILTKDRRSLEKPLRPDFDSQLFKIVKIKLWKIQ